MDALAMGAASVPWRRGAAELEAFLPSRTKLQRRLRHGPMKADFGGMSTPFVGFDVRSSFRRLYCAKPKLSPSGAALLSGFFRSPWKVFVPDELGKEIASIAFPALLGLVSDPLASLVDTAFIGHIGALDLAAAGVAISVFNLISKVVNLPLLNVTTSIIAEENALLETADELLPMMDRGSVHGVRVPSSVGADTRRNLPSVSTALVLGLALGIAESIFLLLGAKFILILMGIPADSPMLAPSQQYLCLRALDAPAIVVSLAMQGVFRGFKDTKTPLLATVVGNVVHIVLDPLFMFYFGYGISGAAIATVISQYLTALILLWELNGLVILVPPAFSKLEIGKYFRSGIYLFLRTASIILTMTWATSRAARLGVAPMAAHQICMQIWLAASLLSDSLAVAAQTLIADSLARGDLQSVKDALVRVLQQASALGIAMAVALELGQTTILGLFTNDFEVLRVIETIMPIVIATQPVNSIAFVLDGVLYGASDFAYAAYSMMSIGVLSSAVLVVSIWFGMTGVWTGLAALMLFRMLAGALRLGTASGPWKFLKEETDGGG